MARPRSVQASERKSENQDLILPLVRSLADPVHEIGEPLLRDLDRRHQTLDLLVVGLCHLARVRFLASLFGLLTVRHVVV